MDDDKLLGFMQTMVAVTVKLGKEHGQDLSKEDAFLIVKDIVSSNYPKCAIKYLTGQEWLL